MLEPTVLILLSDKRSGSTLFQRELVKHSQIKTVRYSSHTYLETHHWLKAAVLMAPKGTASKVYRNYGGRKGARTYMIDTIKGNVPEFEPPSDDQALIVEGWEALCAEFCDPVFFEKSPQILPKRAALEQLLQWVGTTGYRVKIVGLVRNPMSVMYSAFQLFHTDPGTRQFSWAQTQRNLLWVADQLQADQYMQVRYEELIKDPKDTFGRICAFVGLPYETGVGAQAHQESVGLWVKDAHFHFQLAPEVAEVAASFGYTRSELYNPDKARPSALWRLRQRFRRNSHRLRARIIDRWLRPIYLRIRKK